MLVPTFLTELTGGPLNLLRFAMEAAKSGINVRWINLQGEGIQFEYMLELLQKYEGLEQFGIYVKSHVWHATSLNPSTPILTNSNDIFMATVFDSALIASATQRLLKKNPNIIYFIQDIEGIFFPYGSLSVEAAETYDVPHFAIFSTEFLRKYFKVKKLGVYRRGKREGDKRSFASMPAIKPFLLNRENTETPRKRRLIVYAREGTPRNAFELSISAMSECIRLNILDPLKWEFVGVGGHNSKPLCWLNNRKDLCIRMIKNVPEPEYKRLLADADLGLSLMISPHPSLAPFDFVAAGMIVVTNSFETKTQDSFRNISQNIIAAEPSLNGVIKGIEKALDMLENVELKKKEEEEGVSKLNWPTRWDDERCYGKPLFEKIKLWFNHDSIFPFDDLNY